MPALALLLALQSVGSAPPSPLPEPLDGAAGEIRTALESANNAIETAAACAHVRRGYAERLELFRARFGVVVNHAEVLYGPQISPALGNIVINVPCSRAHRRQYLREVEQSLDQAERALGLRLAEMKGLWLGRLHLCRDTVERIDLVDDVYGAKVPAIRLAPAFHAAMRAETGRRVGKRLGLYLDGELIAAPTVMEPISGELQINGPDAGQVERIREAAARPC